MDKAKLISIITESSRIPDGKQIARNYQTLLEKTLEVPRPIKVLTGLRRSGKSFLLKQLYAHLIRNNTPPGNILFINFESDELKDYLSTTGLRKIFATFMTLSDPSQPIYAFLDEIQNVEDWHKYIRTLYDSKTINLYLTGSNNKLLSGEIASTLGGRTLDFHIQPFNFKELLQYHKLTISDAFAAASQRPAIDRIAKNYLDYGGIPEALDLSSELRAAYCISLIEKIVINDIIRRQKLEIPEHLLDLISYLARSLGGIISSKNLAQHTSISDVTVRSYLDYICQTFLVYELKKYHFQARTILDTQKKFYFVDNLFCRIASTGGRLENLVFNEISRVYSSSSVYFARNDRGQEVDFVVVEPGNKVIRAVQVVYDLTDSNIKREIAPLELMRKYHKQKLIYELIYASSNAGAKQIPEWLNVYPYQDWLISQTLNYD